MNLNIEILTKNELLPNEDILWINTPNLSKIFSKGDIFFIPFSVFWWVFAMIWLFGAISVGGVFGIFFGTPLVIIGLFLIFGRFVVKKVTKRDTVYVITNMRVLILKMSSRGVKKSISLLEINTVSNESVSWDINGIGTIIFGVIPLQHTLHLNTGLDFLFAPYQSGIIAFFDIEDCEHVYGIYKKLKHRDR